MAESLRITEVFLSLQGEARTVGFPTVFVRLTGCPLRCGYCDSEYAFHGGKKVSQESLLAEIQGYGVNHICVTGGEPLAQPAVADLLKSLCDLGLSVSLETSGAMDIAVVDDRVSIVMDLKTPGSREVEKNRYQNIKLLTKKDQVKFVLLDRSDYDWAKFKIDEYQIADVVGDILFSPCHQEMNPKVLADWIVEDRLPVRFQLQLHKVLWGDIPGV